MLPNNIDKNLNADVTQQYHTHYGEEAYPALAAIITPNNAKLRRSGERSVTNAEDDSFFDGKSTGIKPPQLTKKYQRQKINLDSSSIDTCASKDRNSSNVVRTSTRVINTASASKKETLYFKAN